MSTLTLLSFLAVLLFFGWKIHRVWRERFGHRDDHYDMLQMQRLLADTDVAARAAAPGQMPFPAAAAPPAPPAAPGAPARSGGERVRLLDASAQEVFVRLSAEFAQIPLLACVDVAALLPAASPAPRIRADFVLCRKDFTPAVVIFIERGDDPLRERAIQLLRQQPLRLLRWSADALPTREAMREQIVKPRKG